MLLNFLISSDFFPWTLPCHVKMEVRHDWLSSSPHEGFEQMRLKSRPREPSPSLTRVGANFYSTVKQQDYSASVWLRRKDKLEHVSQLLFLPTFFFFPIISRPLSRYSVRLTASWDSRRKVLLQAWHLPNDRERSYLEVPQWSDLG